MRRHGSMLLNYKLMPDCRKQYKNVQSTIHFSVMQSFLYQAM